MPAKVMSSFAYGLMVSAIICGAVYFWGPSDSGDAKTAAEPSEETMKEKLEESGYLVLTADEMDERVAAAASETEKEKVEQPESEEVKEEENKEVLVYKTVVTVSSGMTSIDVGDALVKGGLIENAYDFSKEVEKRGVAEGLRLGTFEFDSTMSLDQIIEVLFKKK